MCRMNPAAQFLFSYPAYFAHISFTVSKQPGGTSGFIKMYFNVWIFQPWLKQLSENKISKPLPSASIS
jgi:hypothetical protein